VNFQKFGIKVRLGVLGVQADLEGDQGKGRFFNRSVLRPFGISKIQGSTWHY
jgi:hypothetical protein